MSVPDLGATVRKEQRRQRPSSKLFTASIVMTVSGALALVEQMLN